LSGSIPELPHVAKVFLHRGSQVFRTVRAGQAKLAKFLDLLAKRQKYDVRVRFSLPC